MSITFIFQTYPFKFKYKLTLRSLGVQSKTTLLTNYPNISYFQPCLAICPKRCEPLSLFNIKGSTTDMG